MRPVCRVAELGSLDIITRREDFQTIAGKCLRSAQWLAHRRWLVSVVVFQRTPRDHFDVAGRGVEDDAVRLGDCGEHFYCCQYSGWGWRSLFAEV